MSKKSRRRNKKILGALAAGLGAMALMKGRRANQMSGMETVSDAQKVASQLGTGNVTGTNYPGANKVVETAPKYKFSKRSNRGALDYNRTIPFHPSQGNPSPKWFGKFDQSNLGSGWAAKKGGRAGHKSGGRVGCGKAKRGFGRALKKGK